MGVRFGLTAVLLLAGLLAGVAGAQASPASTGRSSVVLIVLENREYDEVIGDPGAPFLNRLAQRGALATRYYAIAHPSLPNYLALLGGSTFGIAGNCSDCAARGSNLALQLSRAGISWRSYMEGMPHRCFRGDAAGSYVKRHNPFMYFPSIARNRRRCANVVPFGRLDADLHRHSLPAFAWIGPGLCRGGHDCGIEVADRFLAKLVPRLAGQLGPDGFLAVSFDEGSGDAGCCRLAAGGRVATVLSGPTVRRGTRSRSAYDHYSLLATIEDAFGLPRLRHARSSRALKAFAPHRGRKSRSSE